MTEFRIEISPSLPASRGCRTVFPDVSSKYKQVIEKISGQYDVVYHVGDKIFAYYPTDIFNVFSDLVQELDQFRESKSHYVTLVGYTVAYARCKDRRVWFYTPPREFGTEDQVELEGDGIPVHQVVEAFERAANRVWDFMSARVNLHS